MSTVKEFFKRLGAGLLTLALIGSIGGLLAMSLISPQPKPAAEMTTVQTTAPVIETVTVTGTRRAI
jgi:hypothetical protein